MMIKNKTFINFIMVTLMVSFLTISVGKVSPVYGMAALPISDPVYDTEIIALYDYVTQNVDAPQLDIFFFISGALAVAQLGAQDAKLVSPYDSEENIQQWLINCGIQLYNSVIGLVPSGEYYVGVDYPTRGIKRDELKMLVATLMGNAVLARNYNNLDDFLDENPDKILINFNRDLQLGVNAVFGLNGGAYEWQTEQRDWADGSFTWNDSGLNGTAYDEYMQKVNSLPLPRYFANTNYSNSLYWYRGLVFSRSEDMKYDLFINTSNHTVSFHNAPSDYLYADAVYSYQGNSSLVSNFYFKFFTETYNPNDFNEYKDIASYFLNYVPANYSVQSKLIRGGSTTGMSSVYFPNFDFVRRVMVGPTWESAVEIQNLTDLNYDLDNLQYYEQVTNDYLLDIRGLIGDLVNYVYLRNPVLDNLYDLTGNLVLPDLIKVSVDLEPITDLLAPPIPVNLNDIAELTDNTYLERVKEHAKNFGDIFVNYFAFWHNVDSDIIYTLFGATIIVLVGAFIGKWGHS